MWPGCSHTKTAQELCRPALPCFPSPFLVQACCLPARMLYGECTQAQPLLLSLPITPGPALGAACFASFLSPHPPHTHTCLAST